MAFEPMAQKKFKPRTGGTNTGPTGFRHQNPGMTKPSTQFSPDRVNEMMGGAQQQPPGMVDREILSNPNMQFSTVADPTAAKYSDYEPAGWMNARDGTDRFGKDVRNTVLNNITGRKENRPVLDRPKPFQEAGVDVLNRPTPLRDEIQERFGDPYDNYIDDMKGKGDQADFAINKAMGMVNDPNRLNDTVAGLQNEKVTSGIDNLGSSTDNYFDDLEKSGSPFGGRYAGEEMDMMQNLNRLGNKEYSSELGGNVQNLLKDIQGTKSDVGKAADANVIAAMGGNLTDPDSQYYQAVSKQYDTAGDDAMRRVREAAGQQRGIGGGRLNRQLAETGQRISDQKMAELSGLQKSMADQGLGYATTERGQDIDLTQTAAGLGSKVADVNLNAAGQVGNQLGRAGDLSLAQNQFSYQQEKDRTTAQIQRDQWEKEFGNTMNQQQIGNMSDLTGQSFDNTMAIAQNLQDNKALDANTPTALEKILGGISNTAVGAATAGWKGPKFMQ